MVTDPIADLLTRIRNAVQVRYTSVTVPYSKLKHSVLNILAQQGLLGAVSVATNRLTQRSELVAELKYDSRGEPVIEGLERVSRLSQRKYLRAADIPLVRSGLGVLVMTTSQGVMTGFEAKKRRIGGEPLCQVW